MSDFTPGVPTQKTLVFTDNNGRQFTASLTVNPGTPGADGDPSGALPLTGGTLSGDLIIDNGAAPTAWGSGPRFLRQIGAKQIYEYAQMDASNNIQLLLSDNDHAPWAFCPGKGTIITPANRTLMEDLSNGDHPIVVQRFSVNAGNGSYVAFPQSFSSDNVRVIVPSYYDTVNFIVGGITRQSPPNRNGFTLSRLYTGPNGTGWASNTDTVDIIAIGEG